MEYTILEKENFNLYLRFNYKYFDEFCPTPYAAMTVNVKICNSGLCGEDLVFQGEDAFVMLGEPYRQFLEKLRNLSRKYAEAQVRLVDYDADTDGYINFDCRDNSVDISGQLGATFLPGCPVLKFTGVICDYTVLEKLYNVLIENSIMK